MSYVNAEQAAHRLGVERHTIAAWIRSGKLPAIKYEHTLGQSYLIDTRDLVGLRRNERPRCSEGCRCKRHQNPGRPRKAAVDG